MPYQKKLSSFQQCILDLLTATIARLETWKSSLLAQQTTSYTASPIAEETAIPASSVVPEQHEQESTSWQMVQIAEDATTPPSIVDVQPRQAYVPGNIRDTPLVNTTKELLAQYI